MRILPLLLLSIVFSLAAAPSSAANQQDPPQSESAKDELMSAETFAGLKLRSIGPALMAGRIGDFAVNPNDRAHYLVAVASGGVWKTTDGGQTWRSLTDGLISDLSVGAIAYAPANPDTVYLGTGEGGDAIDFIPGIGLVRSLDGGRVLDSPRLRHRAGVLRDLGRSPR